MADWVQKYGFKGEHIDLLFHGSPCQDFSVAGRQAGGEEGSGTRSSLLFETVRIVEKVLPTWVIWENVPNVLNKKHHPVLEDYISRLESFGYYSEYKLLQALDFDIPQHRKRVFCVSKLGGSKGSIQWPEAKDLSRNLHSMLEPEPVAENFYYTKEQSEGVILKHQETSYCIDANYHKGITPTEFNIKGRRQLLQVPGELGINGHDSIKRVYDPEGASPTLNTMSGGNRQPKVVVDGLYVDQLNRKKAGMQPEASVTIKAQHSGHAGVTDGHRIRRLTPKECWRLMGFPDQAFEKAQAVNSNSRLYMQAGNSIVVPVIVAIYNANKIR
jgi:DNA (cytosine-5)-methyltransferase 1